MAFPALVSLDDGDGPVFLTDQGRTFTEPMDNRKVDVQLASGTLKRYNQAKKRQWTFTWQWLPTSSTNTYDGNAGRDAVRTFAYEPRTLILSLANHPLNAPETYVVHVESYQEEMQRRDQTLGEHFWNVTLELKEV